MIEIHECNIVYKGEMSEFVASHPFSDFILV